MPPHDTPKTQNKPYTMHVISHTHWDREWYQEFQGYRQRLVFQIDALLDLLDTRPEYKHFHLDGQTSCVEDYLAIRPENTERLFQHIRSGRILIGPWFVMPDELLLSGESLVRNLLYGHQLCSKWDVNPMKVGYVTDVFGHCSQLPQILRGFGIDNAILHRGTSNDDEKSEMVWEGADGTELLLIKVYPHTGYQDFLQLREAPEHILLDYEQRKHELATTNILFALDGNDHQPAYWNIPEIIERVNLIFQKTHCVHSSLPTFLAELRSALGPKWQEGLKRLKGELRRPNKHGAYAEVFHGTASSRVYLKQANDQLEYLLPRCAEALHAWSVLLGGDSQKAFLDLGWKYLLLCHPHDSIVGCSIDQVHRDAMYRFDQARCIAQNSIWESAFVIADKIDTSLLPGYGPVVTVHNFASVEREPVVRFWFYIPEPLLEEKKKQGLSSIALIDEENRPISCSIKETSREPFPIPFVRKTRNHTPMFGWIPDALTTHVRYDVTALASIPPMGYKSWRVVFLPKQTQSLSRQKHIEPVISDSNNYTIENQFLKLCAREDGLIDLLDKRTGVWYHDLHEIEDCGDAGTGWDHVYPERDTRILSSRQCRGPVKIRVYQQNPISAELEIAYHIKVPTDLTKSRQERSRRLTAINVRTRFRVDSGCRRIDCVTVINNTARNHRMRLLFPTDRQCNTWFCDTAFDCVTRQVKLLDTTDWQERDREESPIKNFAGIQDDTGGIAVITRGLCEACVRDDERRTLALTLFRGFEQRIGGTRTVDSQMLGNVVCEYSICTLDQHSTAMDLFREVEQCKIPLIPLTTAIPQPGHLKPQLSFVRIEGEIVVSTIKLSEDGQGVVIRLFNPSEYGQSVELDFAFKVAEAHKCDMLESPTEPVDILNSNRVRLTAKRKEIVTLKLVFDETVLRQVQKE